MPPGRIIFLNGTSSSGKTSIVKAFQEMVDEPYMHLSIDLFLQTIPQRFWESPQAGVINGVFHNAVTGYHRCMVTLAGAGNNLIVDHVLQEAEWWAECARLLAPLHALLVQVYCPLEELERRERARGDRAPGLARFQFERVYGPGRYDLLVDTSRSDPASNARQIADYVNRGGAATAFQSLVGSTAQSTEFNS